MSRLGLSITNIFNVIAAEQPEEPIVIATGQFGESGLIYRTEYESGEYVQYEAPFDNTGIVTRVVLTSGGAPDLGLSYYNFESNHQNKVSINQIETWVAGGSLTINNLVYSDWEILTLPAELSEEEKYQALINYGTYCISINSNNNYNRLIKIGEQYHFVFFTNMGSVSSISYELFPLTFDSNGYLAADNNAFQNFLPAISRSFSTVTAEITTIPVPLSFMHLVNSRSEFLPPITTTSLLDYLSVISSQGVMSDVFIIQNTNRYPISNTYLRKNIDSASLFPNSTYPPDNTVVYPIPLGMPASLTTSNMQINILVASYTTQQPPAPWYNAVQNTNPNNVKIICTIYCWGNRFGTLPAGSTTVSAVGTRASQLILGKYYEAWKFSINLSNLAIYPKIVNGALTYTTVDDQAYDGTEGTFKSAVFSIFSIKYAADGYYTSEELGPITSSVMITVPTFTGSEAFGVGVDMTEYLYLGAGTLTGSNIVINKNRKVVDEIPPTLETLEATDEAFGLRPLTY